jgi:putative FmdB family regulatory protein
MPIYEYQCTACDYRFEKLQKMSDEPLVDCPSCEKPELKKLVSAAGFQLKGSGWYVTDFKNSGQASKSKDSASSRSQSADSTTKSGGCGSGACGHQH